MIIPIVNTACPEWMAPLSKYDARLSIIELYRSDRNEHIIRANGYLPAPPEEGISDCYFDPQLRRFLRIIAPSILPKRETRLKIYYEDRVTEWDRCDIKDAVFLLPVKANPLNTIHRYVLIRLSDGSLVIRQRK